MSVQWCGFVVRGLSWAGVLVWTTTVAVLLLKPVNNLTNHELSFKNFIASFFSLSLDTSDLVEWGYHILLFAVLTVVWFWALSAHLSRNRALMWSIGVAVLLGVVTEIGQYFVHRGSLMLDAIANFLGVTVSVVWIKCLRPQA